MPVVWPAVGASVLPNVGGWVGGLIVSKNINSWYRNLKKPTWTPPDKAFGPIWTTLYTSMGYASYLVWRDGGGFDGPAKFPLMLYGSQLLLNWAWTPIFFGYHKLFLSVVDIGLLWGNVAVCAYAFYGINKTAGLIMIPYLLWGTFATCLNTRIYLDNKDESKEKNIKE